MKTRSFLQGLGYPIEKPNMGTEALYGMVWIAERAQAEAARALRPFGLTPGTLNYLMVVKHIGGEEGLLQREIAERMLIKKENVTRTLKALEARKWISRRPGADRRSRQITITPTGNQLLTKVWPVYDAAVRRLTKHLPEAKQHQMVEILSQWREALDG